MRSSSVCGPPQDNRIIFKAVLSEAACSPPQARGVQAPVMRIQTACCASPDSAETNSGSPGAGSFDDFNEGEAPLPQRVAGQCQLME
jgi:hypothetical protein